MTSCIPEGNINYIFPCTLHPSYTPAGIVLEYTYVGYIYNNVILCMHGCIMTENKCACSYIHTMSHLFR